MYRLLFLYISTNTRFLVWMFMYGACVSTMYMNVRVYVYIYICRYAYMFVWMCVRTHVDCNTEFTKSSESSRSTNAVEFLRLLLHPCGSLHSTRLVHIPTYRSVTCKCMFVHSCIHSCSCTTYIVRIYLCIL